MSYKDEDTLRELYWEEGMSLVEIGDKYDVYDTTILGWMERFGIERRDSPSDKVGSHSVENTNGYEEMRFQSGDDSGVRIHRLSAVAWFGYDAVVDNVIHHKNAHRFDNRESNLKPMELSKHSSFHNKCEPGVEELVIPDEPNGQRELSSYAD